MLKQQALDKAYKEGYDACRYGGHCAYRRGGELSKAWSDGWQQGFHLHGQCRTVKPATPIKRSVSAVVAALWEEMYWL